MTIYERLNYQTFVVVHKSLNVLTPNYLQNILETSSIEHSYCLRNPGNTFKFHACRQICTIFLLRAWTIVC